MNYDYKLSICMMVKDEEKNLGRCLEALSFLLGKPDVELIIVDTGSKDKTVDIAQKYTSKLYFHEWQQHFSNMRNITISYAKGEWILILDADEVLINTEKLYEMLIGEESKKFNTIVLKIKNYSSFGRKASYTVLPQERVFRNDGTFHYEGSVHNQPKCKPPICNTDIYLDHYGYIFRGNKELSEKKFQRTAGILKKELEKDPDNIYYRYQLARSYNAHQDKNEALCEIRKAYALISPMNDASKRKISYVYITYAHIGCEQKEYNEALDVCKEGISLRSDLIDLYYLSAFSLLHLGKQQDAVRYYLDYLEKANNYEKLPISSDRSVETHYLSANFIDTALNCIISNFYNKGEYDKAYEYVNQVADIEIRLPFLIKVLVKLGKFDELRYTLEEAGNDQTLRDMLISTLENIKKDLTYDANRKLEMCLSYGDDIYSLLNRIRICEPEDRESLINQAVGIANFNELADFYAEILSNIDTNPRQVFSILKKANKLKIKQFVKYLSDKYENINEYFIKYLREENIRDNDYQGLKVYISIASLMLYKEAEMVKSQKRDISEHYYDIFKLYVYRGMKYVCMLYNIQRLRLNYSTIEDDEDRLFAALHYVLESIAGSDNRSGIRYFKDAVKAYPYMACFMDIYKDELFGHLSNDSLLS